MQHGLSKLKNFDAIEHSMRRRSFKNAIQSQVKGLYERRDIKINTLKVSVWHLPAFPRSTFNYRECREDCRPKCRPKSSMRERSSLVKESGHHIANKTRADGLQSKTWLVCWIKD